MNSFWAALITGFFFSAMLITIFLFSELIIGYGFDDETFTYIIFSIAGGGFLGGFIYALIKGLEI